MAMMILLLVSAMAQLVSPSPTNRLHSPHLNLNHIIELTAKYKTNFTQDLFVEDVEPLFNKGCKNDFFCKVEDILQHRGKETDIVENLVIYNKRLNVNCTDVLANVPKSEVSKPITDLLLHLEKCSKSRNFKAEPKSSTS